MVNNNKKNNKRLIHRQGRRALVRRSVRASKKREDGDDGDGDDDGKVCGGPRNGNFVDCRDGEPSSREIINYGKSKIKIIIIIRRQPTRHDHITVGIMTPP